MNRSRRLLVAGIGALALIAAAALTAKPAEAHFFYRHGFYRYGFVRPVFYPRPAYFGAYFLPPPRPVYVVPRVAYIPPPPPPVAYGYSYGYRYHRVVHHYRRHIVHKVAAVHHPACTCACCPK